MGTDWGRGPNLQDKLWVASGLAAERAPNSVSAAFHPWGVKLGLPKQSGQRVLPRPRVPGLPRPSPSPECCHRNGKRCPSFIRERMN